MDLLELVPPEKEHNKEFLQALAKYEFALLQVHVLKFMQTRRCRVVKKPKQRSVWVHPYLTRREEFGHYHHLMSELATENPHLCRNFTRMPVDLFNHIVERVTPYIQKKRTFWRKPLGLVCVLPSPYGFLPQVTPTRGWHIRFVLLTTQSANLCQKLVGPL